LDRALTLSLLHQSLLICRLPADAPIPDWLPVDGFLSVTRTPNELSLVCSREGVPESIQQEGPWRALKVEGPLDFSLTGILAGLSGVLALAEVSLFAISTYDTDYILVQEKDLDKALAALSSAGYQMPGTA
jgi:uncharacterized protein